MTNDIKEIESFWEYTIKKNIYLRDKYLHSVRVANYLVQITGDASKAIYGYTHDLGRIPQLLKYGSYDDIAESHAVLGEEYIRTNPELQFVNTIEHRMVARYHSDYSEIPEDCDLEIRELIKNVSNADRVDNALSCSGYLEHEQSVDAKGFIKRGTNSSILSEYYLESLINRDYNVKKLDNNKVYCNSYVDYFYFAYTLVTRTLHDKELFNSIAESPGIIEEYVQTLNFFENLFLKNIEDEEQFMLLYKDIQRNKEFLYNREEGE